MEYANQNWRLAMSRFIIEFGDRLSDTFNTAAVTQNYLQGHSEFSEN